MGGRMLLSPTLRLRRPALRLLRSWPQMRRWIARRRRRQTLAALDELAELDDWILRDIGVIRERDIGMGFEADPRNPAEQFWRP
jgi:uncharacterized protein YjiS (DUF1127 family)